jgi:hypothetical protein
MKKICAFLLVTLGMLTACSHAPSQKNAQNLLQKPDQKSSKSKSHEMPGMQCIAKNIYVDAKMSEEQRQEFLQVVHQSKTEISRFFGGVRSNPNIYACVSESCFRQFGGVPALAKAMGDDTVLLSSKALNKVALTHELAHVEFHKRLGSAKAWNKVPMWFDEGLAVLACKDPKYNKPVARIPLKKLTSQDQWVNAVRAQLPAYSVAKQAVQSWYKTAGSRGLQAMISRMQKGNSFSSSLSLGSELQLSGL